MNTANCKVKDASRVTWGNTTFIYFFYIILILPCAIFCLLSVSGQHRDCAFEQVQARFLHVGQRALVTSQMTSCMMPWLINLALRCHLQCWARIRTPLKKMFLFLSGWCICEIKHMCTYTCPQFHVTLFSPLPYCLIITLVAYPKPAYV